MKKTIIAIVLLIIGGICSFAQSGGSTIDLLKSDDFGKRKEGIEILRQQRNQSIEDMIATLNGKSSSDVKDSAAIALGDCRGSEAVDVLIKNIGLDVRGRAIKGFLSEEELHPVSTALEKIGNPSIPAVIRFLEENANVPEGGKTLDDRRNTEIRALLLQTLCHIDGDKDVVRLRFQEALKAESDPQKQDRLQSALQELDKASF
jgi:hypothetical protein